MNNQDRRSNARLALRDSLPVIPEWLSCCAWHNDVAPIWRDDSERICLVTDYPDPQRREFPQAPRFQAWLMDEENIQQLGEAVGSDDFTVILTELQRLKNQI